MEYGKAMTIYLSSLAADCFPARDCGPSVSMVITGRSSHHCVSSSQSICYKLYIEKFDGGNFSAFNTKYAKMRQRGEGDTLTFDIDRFGRKKRVGFFWTISEQ